MPSISTTGYLDYNEYQPMVLYYLDEMTTASTYNYDIQRNEALAWGD